MVSTSGGLANITDHALAIDSFKNTVTYKGFSAIEMQICRLIMIEPGTYETHPELGVGLVSRFRDAPSSELETLDRRIKEQMTTYMPDVYGVEVKTSLVPKTGELRIAVKANGQVFAFTFNKNQSTLKAEKVAINSLDSFA